MGMNVSRIRTGNGVVSNWMVDNDGSDGYGGGVIATDAAGNMFIIPVKKTGNLNYTISDAALFDRRMIGIYPGDYNESTGEIGEGFMKVQGNIVCRDLEVTLTGWWDDVFKPDYKLMSIEELELFIAMNGHLPGIPTEEEVIGKTMSVQEMNLMLLKKVEELSLYIIDLQNQINELKEGE
jgi:hypothetical protein